MSDEIIGRHNWLYSAPGQYLLAWEQAQMEQAVDNVFGFHALQLGLPQLDALQANRMPHRWLATQSAFEAELFSDQAKTTRPVALVSDFSALPFSANSLDLVVLPHALELSANPHGVLRETERVLLPEGRVVICGLNPFSLWGFCRRWLAAQPLLLPVAGERIGYLRLRDWLSLLNLEIESVHFGCYCPPCSSQLWLRRFEWMDRIGAHWWPILGSAYLLVAIKRVRSVTPINPARKPVLRLAAGPLVATHHVGNLRMPCKSQAQPQQQNHNAPSTEQH